MAQSPVSYSNGTPTPPQEMSYPYVVQFPPSQHPSQVFPQNLSPMNMSSEIRGLPFPTMTARYTPLQHANGPAQMAGIMFSLQSNATATLTGIPPESQQMPNPIIPPGQPPFQYFGAGGQQMPFQGAPWPTTVNQPTINPGPTPAPVPPAAQAQDLPQPQILDRVTQMVHETQHMFIQPRHYEPQYLQSNITCLRNIHDWLTTTALPCVHDVRLILNQLRNILWEIDLCIVTLVAIGGNTALIARKTKDVVQDMYHRACGFLQRQATPVATDQTPAPAQEQFHNPNPWTSVHGQQQHYPTNPSFPVPGQTQFHYTNPQVPVPGQRQPYNTDPTPPVLPQTQPHETNPSVTIPPLNQPYHADLSTSVVQHHYTYPSTIPTEDQPYYTSSRVFNPAPFVHSAETPQDGTTPYATPPESPSQIRFDFNWGDQ